MPIKGFVPADEHDTKQNISNNVSILSGLMKSLFPAQIGGPVVRFSPFTPHYRGFCLTFLERIVAKQRDIEGDRRLFLLLTRSFPYKETSTKSFWINGDIFWSFLSRRGFFVFVF